MYREQSPWPIVGAVALFLIAFGAGHFVNEVTRGKEGYGSYLLLAGVATVIVYVGWLVSECH